MAELGTSRVNTQVRVRQYTLELASFMVLINIFELEW